MSMIYNGIKYDILEDLELAISELSEDQKILIRNDFNGIPNQTTISNVPKIVTPRQIRLALILSGVSLDIIETAINSLPEPQKSMTRITWEYSVEFQRTNPMISAMSPMLGLTSEQIDNLFILAATL